MMAIGVVMVASMVAMALTFIIGLVNGNVFEYPYTFLKVAAVAAIINVGGYYFNKKMESKYFEPVLE